MNEVVIVGAARSATGKFGGSLAGTGTAALGATVIKAAVDRAGVAVDQVDEAILGTVYQGGLGPNLCRQAAVAAGLPYEVPAMTVNTRNAGICARRVKPDADSSDFIVVGATSPRPGPWEQEWPRGLQRPVPA